MFADNYAQLKNHPIRVISLENVEKLLSMEEGIRLTEQAYQDLAEDKIICPLKTSVKLPDNSPDLAARINSMPAVIPAAGVVGLKWVCVVWKNKTKNLPTTIGSILLNDAHTGVPLALIDGTHITHVRTGASVAIGAKYLAPKISDKITVIGTGNEACSSILALTTLFDIKKIAIVGRTLEATKKFIANMSEKINTEFEIFTSHEEAVKQSSIIVVATTSSKPVIYADWLKSGDFLCGISNLKDIDHHVINNKFKIIFDSMDGGLKRVADICEEDFFNNLEQSKFFDFCTLLKNNSLKSSPSSDIRCFFPAGLGAVDIAIANYVYKKAQELAMGQDVALF